MEMANVVKQSESQSAQDGRKKEVRFSHPYSMRVNVDAEKLDLGVVRLSSIITKPTLTRTIVLGYSGEAPNGRLRLSSLTPWVTLSLTEFAFHERAGAFNLQLVVDLYQCWQDRKDRGQNRIESLLELSVAIDSEKQKLTIPVLIEFKRNLPPPQKRILELSRSELDLGEAPLACEGERYDAPSKQHIRLRNAGDAVLVEEVQCDANWVHVEPLRLRLQPGEEQLLSVWASPVNVSTGVYTKSVRFLNAEHTLSVQVKVIASGPIPQLEDSQIFLPDLPLGQEEHTHWLKIRNIGIGVLTVQVPSLENRLEKKEYEIHRGTEEREPAWAEIPLPLPMKRSPGESHTVELTLHTNSQFASLRTIPLRLAYRIASPVVTKVPVRAEPPTPLPPSTSIKKPSPPLIRQPTIHVSDLDFGQMKPKGRKTVPLKIENRGQEMLVIEKIVVHDGWIRVDVPRDGQNKRAFSGTFEITVNPHRAKAKKGGKVSGKITIYSNDPEQPARDVPVLLQATS